MFRHLSGAMRTARILQDTWRPGRDLKTELQGISEELSLELACSIWKLRLTLYRRSADYIILRASPYRAVNTYHLGYKNQSVYAVSGTSRCLFSDKYKTY